MEELQGGCSEIAKRHCAQTRTKLEMKIKKTKEKLKKIRECLDLDSNNDT
jgi:hypothetical protein